MRAGRTAEAGSNVNVRAVTIYLCGRVCGAVTVCAVTAKSVNSYAVACWVCLQGGFENINTRDMLYRNLYQDV